MVPMFPTTVTSDAGKKKQKLTAISNHAYKVLLVLLTWCEADCIVNV